MPMFPLHALDVQTALLLCFVSVAAVSDVLTRRIPNALIGLGLSTSLMLTAQGQGWGGLVHFILGAGLVFVMYLIPYVLGMLGAGDVKLLGTVGSFLGPSLGFWNGLNCALVGGVLCVMVFLIPRYSHTVTRVPFGLAIAIGTLGSVLMGR